MLCQFHMFTYENSTLIKINIDFTFEITWITNFVFGDRNLNLVASMTTSVIEVGDRKFWIIFRC
jgi:hypothetical protein